MASLTKFIIQFLVWTSKIRNCNEKHHLTVKHIPYRQAPLQARFLVDLCIPKKHLHFKMYKIYKIKSGAIYKNQLPVERLHSSKIYRLVTNCF